MTELLTADDRSVALEMARRLDSLLAEPVADARRRESSAFAASAGSAAERVVLFGSGGFGRMAQRALRADGIEPLAFVDNNPERWGTTIDGTPVLSPEEAAGRHRDAAFVVTIWGAGSPHRFAHTVEQLAALGVPIVRPGAELAWAHPAGLLPHYAMDFPSRLLEQAERVREAFDVLADDRSRREYVDQIAWRLTGNPECLGPKEAGPQYLLPELVRPVPNEVIVDCGAYDGDTLESWLAERGPDFARWVALEPDVDSRGRLERYVASLPDEIRDRITVVPFAVGSREERVSFAALGTASSYVGVADDQADGPDSVRSLPLDALCRELDLPPVTFLKMDVEGAEPDAIAGATSVIGSGRALLTLSVYHVQDHLWQIPLTVHRLRPDLQLSLRPHNEQGWDLVLYAVPPGRSLSGPA